MKIVSWNIARHDEPWRLLLDMDADVALLQEATAPPPDVAERIDVDPAQWCTVGADGDRPWRTAIVKLSDRIQVEWIEAKSLEDAASGELAG